MILRAPSGAESVLLSESNNVAGNWTLLLMDRAAQDTITVTDLLARFYTVPSTDERYVDADAYSEVVATSRFYRSADDVDTNGGIDTINASAPNTASRIFLDGYSTIDGVMTHVTIVENAIGGSGKDMLVGTSMDNVLVGACGAATAYGGDGNDSPDRGSGNDTLDGGAGNDSLTGGSGADVFVFDAALGAGNVDTITGYVVANDMIQLDDAFFTGLAVQGLSAASFVANEAGLAATADQRIIYQTTTGKLCFDADGTGSGSTAALFAKLTANHAGFNEADFVVV